MSAILERLKYLLGEEILSDDHWRAFLDEVGAYSETVEQEARSLQANSKVLLAIIDLIPVAFFVKDHESRFFFNKPRVRRTVGAVFRSAARYGWKSIFPARSDGAVSGQGSIRF